MSGHKLKNKNDIICLIIFNIKLKFKFQNVQFFAFQSDFSPTTIVETRIRFPDFFLFLSNDFSLAFELFNYT